MSMIRFSKKTKEKLGYYVYALVDPTDDSIFYVGKASANDRAFNHLKASIQETEKAKVIARIRRAEAEPKIEVLRYGLKTEEAAFEVEAAIIDTIGLENLTNVNRGHRIEGSRLSAQEAERMHGSKPVRLSTINEPYMLFFINQSYSPTLSEQELYDNVRQFWHQVASAKRKPTETVCLPYPVALAIVDSTVVRIYSIEAWFPAGATMSSRTFESKQRDESNKWEFVGQRIHNNPLEGRKIVDENDQPIPANQIGYGYIN